MKRATQTVYNRIKLIWVCTVSHSKLIHFFSIFPSTMFRDISDMFKLLWNGTLSGDAIRHFDFGPSQNWVRTLFGGNFVAPGSKEIVAKTVCLYQAVWIRALHFQTPEGNGNRKKVILKTQRLRCCSYKTLTDIQTDISSPYHWFKHDINARRADFAAWWRRM